VFAALRALEAPARRTDSYSVSAATARAVFIALCERARREHPAEVFRASVREVAELSHLRRDTAQAALACLAAAGYIKPCGHNPAGAGLFAFEPGLFHKRDSTPHWSLGTVPVVEHSAWARGGLGDTARRAWVVILGEPMRAADVARRLEVSPATASRTLNALEGQGLAQRGPGRHWEGLAAGTADLDHIAAGLGVVERDAQRRALHERQRAADVTRAILRRMRARVATE
jgi:DNA-binding MarR family transcriptional regulator